LRNRLPRRKGPIVRLQPDGFSGYSSAKAALDSELAKADGREPMPRWVLHDLRRTAKTLMERAGVRPDISERVLAHVIKGVEGVYHRHGYLPEKLDALMKLDALVDRIFAMDVD
jgi:integrase